MSRSKLAPYGHHAELAVISSLSLQGVTLPRSNGRSTMIAVRLGENP